MAKHSGTVGLLSLPKQQYRLAISSLFIVFCLLSACQSSRNVPSPTVVSTLPTSTSTPVPTVTPTSTATFMPTVTHTSTSTNTPTATSTSTSTPTPTSTFTPTPTPTPTHPLMISVMRQQEYPGSEIMLESKLDSGINYDRYIASYLSEDLKIFALLTVPQGEKPQNGWPVIIFNHGYIPPEQYRTTERYVAYVDAFARNGYLVFRPDYRGHGSSEGEPSSVFSSPSYTIDVLNAVASVKQYSDADPDRIGMWGHSMGGGITVRSMVVSQDIKAGVIWAGMTASYEDLFEWIERRMAERPTPTPAPTLVPSLTLTPTSRLGMHKMLETYGSLEENPVFWQSINPMFFLDDLSGPVQLHHGTTDETVPLLFSEKLYERLQAVDMMSELYTYKDDNHNISNNFATAIQRSIQFFDNYVKQDQAQTTP